ncbi:MAG TPA: hypothetical protein VFS00_20190, partial [Polyangiaceae bacterium]|nr:hypothetical protein [Polyangiaceae bacterium]
MRAPASNRLLWALPLGAALALAAALGARRGGAGGGPGASPSAGPIAVDAPGAPPAAEAPDAPSPRRERPGRDRPRARQPEALPTHDAGLRAYAEARKAGEKNPGERAFRAEAKAFFDHNAEFAADKASRKGVTLGELSELTYLGMLGMHLRRWGPVEQAAGRALTPEERGRAEELIVWASDALKAALDEQVAQGATEEARWQTIRAHEARFVEQYRAITGLSPEGFDRLLGQNFESGQGAAP